jgi:hypothetical protein
VEKIIVSGKITIQFIGIDGWYRCVFKGDNGKFYKTVELDPDEGFANLSREDQLALLESLHCTDEFDGEPGWPCKMENFIFNDANL